MRSTLLVVAALSCACGGSLDASAAAGGGTPPGGDADGGDSASSSPDASGALLDSGAQESESPDVGNADDANADGDGLPFVVVDQVAFTADGTSSAVNKLELLSYGGACARLQQGSLTPNSAYLDFIGAKGTSFALGTVTVGAKLSINLIKRDALCNATEFQAIAGSLTIATLDSTSLTGSFTAAVEGVATVAGNIDALICSGATPPGSACVP
jgi:hypothetical protein